MYVAYIHYVTLRYSTLQERSWFTLVKDKTSIEPFDCLVSSRFTQMNFVACKTLCQGQSVCLMARAVERS